MKKISFILSFVLLMQTLMCLFCGTAFSVGIGYPVRYDFENGKDGWDLRGSGNASLSVQKENNNSFLRLSAKAENTFTSAMTLDRIPSVYNKFSDGFNFSPDSKITVSADIRTNDFSKFEKSVMINRDRITSNNVQYHLSTLWGWKYDDSVYLYNTQNKRAVGDYYQAKTNNVCFGGLENDKWYTFVTDITTDASAKPSKIKLSVYAGSNTVYQGEENEITNISLNGFDSITCLDFALSNADETITADCWLDIDNVSIVSDSKQKYWDLCGESLVRGKEVTLKFNTAVDETLLADNITIRNTKGDNISYSGVYDAKLYHYTMTAADLVSGEYTVTVNKSPLGLADDAKSSVDFTVFIGALPTVSKCIANGSITEGSLLTAKAVYYQPDGISGSCRIQWMKSESADSGFENISGAEADSYTVTAADIRSYFKFCATPVTDSGIEGESAESNVIIPYLPPQALNVNIAGLPYVGMEAEIGYDYFDTNGDKEGNSICIWYCSDNGADNWQALSDTKRYLVLDSNFIGKYLRAAVTPYSLNSPYEGDTVYSPKFGPVINGDSLNMVTNPGFETGTTDSWTVDNAGSDTAIVTVTDEDKYSGKYCAKFKGQTSNSTFIRYKGVNMNADTLYLICVKMKLAPDCEMDNITLSAYNVNQNDSGIIKKIVSGGVINKTEWTKVYITVYASTAQNNIAVFPVYWANGTVGYSVYIDDMYVAPLIVSDIETDTPGSVAIPISGSNTADLNAYSVKNQFGDNAGLEGETVCWTMNDKVTGVSVGSSKMVVTNEAVAGTVTVKAVCEPSYDGAVQKRYTKSIDIKLTPNSDTSPKVTNVKLRGNTGEGSTLVLSYDYYQVEGLADSSVIKWYSADSESGPFSPIVSASGNSFAVDASYVGKFIKAVITPTASDGKTGTAEESNINGPKRAPQAKNVSISGKTQYASVLTGTYEYYDFNGDEEGTSQLKWYRASAKNGTYSEIENASGSTYTLGDDDINAYIKFAVQPEAAAEPFTGESVFSEALMGPSVPVAKNVAIRKSGSVLIGTYVFYSENGTEEGESICEWYRNGSRIGTGTQYVLSTGESGKFTFCVTPIAKNKPFEGETVSAVYSVSSSVSGGGSSGGGSGGKWTVTAPSASAALPTVPPLTNNSNMFSDITDSWEWARPAIEALAEKGVISGRGSGIYAPEDSVSRAEFIKLVVSVFGLINDSANCPFYDVEKDDWYYGYVAAAYEKGIVKGDESGNFDPNGDISRQDAAVMILNAVNASDRELPLNAEIEFGDAGTISNYASEAVKRLSQAEIINGIDGDFFPRNNCTRAQAAVMLYKSAEKTGL